MGGGSGGRAYEPLDSFTGIVPRRHSLPTPREVGTSGTNADCRGMADCGAASGAPLYVLEWRWLCRGDAAEGPNNDRSTGPAALACEALVSPLGRRIFGSSVTHNGVWDAAGVRTSVLGSGVSSVEGTVTLCEAPFWSSAARPRAVLGVGT